MENRYGKKMEGTFHNQRRFYFPSVKYSKHLVIIHTKFCIITKVCIFQQYKCAFHIDHNKKELFPYIRGVAIK